MYEPGQISEAIDPLLKKQSAAFNKFMQKAMNSSKFDEDEGHCKHNSFCVNFYIFILAEVLSELYSPRVIEGMKTDIRSWLTDTLNECLKHKKVDVRIIRTF